MRTALWFAVAGCILAVTGCAVLDSAFGVDPDRPDLPPAPGGGAAGSLLGLLFPGGIGAAAGGVLGHLYAALRRRKYVQAGYALTPAIEEILGRLSEKQRLTVEDAKEILVYWQEKLKAREAVEAVRLENPDDPKV